MKRFCKMVGLLMALPFLFLNMPAASADTAIPSTFKVDGWWGVNNTLYKTGTGADDITTKYLYPNFPISCHVAGNNAFEVFWVYPSDTTDDADVVQIRRLLAATASGFAASAKEILGTGNTPLRSAHAPEFTTWQDTDGNCYPLINRVAVPRSVLSLDVLDTGGLSDWLKANGKVQPGKKFIAITQYVARNCNTDVNCFTGLTTGPAVANPAMSNPANYGNDGIFLNASGNRDQHWSDLAKPLMHEVAHSLGATVVGVAPHDDGSGHPTDCFDILCHGWAGVDTLVCGSGTLSTLDNRLWFRADCNKDDYFSVNHPAWETQWWNTAFNSFLWANGQPPA